MGERHYKIATAVRKTLAEYEELKDIIAMLGFDELPEKDQQTVLTARKLERFLTQPFFTTQQFTGMEVSPSIWKTPLTDANEFCRANLMTCPKTISFMIGKVDEALQKRKKKEAR